MQWTKVLTMCCFSRIRRVSAAYYVCEKCGKDVTMTVARISSGRKQP